MNYTTIKDCDNYIVYENGDVMNINTKKNIKVTNNNNRYYIRLIMNNKKSKSFTLSRLVYESFYNEILSDNDIIRYNDNNKTNFHYTNLKKVHRIDMFKVDEKIELDPTKEWKKIDGYDDYYISNYGDVFSIKINKFLEPVTDYNHQTIKLTKDKNTRKTFLLHRLIYELFNSNSDICNV